MGLASGSLTATMPYSVSEPMMYGPAAASRAGSFWALLPSLFDANRFRYSTLCLSSFQGAPPWSAPWGLMPVLSCRRFSTSGVVPEWFSALQPPR